MEHFSVKWINYQREPKHPANPDYPNGIAVDITTDPTKPSCTVPLDYPAARVGAYIVECQKCGLVTLLTTAGRADDPISVKLPCKITTQLGQNVPAGLP